MDYKSLLTQVQKTIASLETTSDSRMTIARIAESIASNFRDQLGITGGRLYECREEFYELINRFGESHEGAVGILIPAEYPPIEAALENGVVVMDLTDPGVDPVLEQKLGAGRFAAVAVGDEDYILSFNVAQDLSREDILFSLNIIRYSINQKLRADRYASLIAEAQRIQQSILPSKMPQFPGFDIYGRAIPAEVVSGDFFDFVPLSSSVLGLAIADGSGHGLPAALVVRDVYMGLRMAADRDFKIIRTLEKLNQIIHRSRLTTKFVSLFYGELESSGLLIYSNAGHNYPFLLKGERFDLLRHGGTVLGPTPDATYTRGYNTMETGDVLCLYSDGIVEAHHSETAEEFGLGRLQRLVLENRERTAQEMVSAIFKAVDAWSSEAEDDRTVVIVKML